MVALGQRTEGGFGNFRFCASFCAPPGIAFFPAAFAPSTEAGAEATDGRMKFALGLECGDVALGALAAAASQQAAAGLPSGTRLPIATVTEALSAAFSALLVPLEEAAKVAALSVSHGPAQVLYGGIDASLNPGLDPSYSVGAAFEVALGGRPFGSGGTLAVAAAVTKALKSLPVDLCGYSGLMLPPLEDETLARRLESDEAFGITDLLSYSSVCGVGLDTVPIPGDTPVDAVAALLLDTAALAAKWNKPLSGRLFPVPGKKAGDRTEFDSPFLINTRVFKMPIT